MSRVCPDCACAMEERTFRDVTIDVCAHCAGMFFDDEELERLRQLGGDTLDQVEASATPVASGKGDLARRVCPGCGHAMKAYHYLYSSPIVLNGCDHCNGIFAENGELVRMQTYLQQDREDNSLATEKAIAVANLQLAAAKHRDRARQIERFLKYAAQPISPASNLAISPIDL